MSDRMSEKVVDQKKCHIKCGIKCTNAALGTTREVTDFSSTARTPRWTLWGNTRAVPPLYVYIYIYIYI